LRGSRLILGLSLAAMLVSGKVSSAQEGGTVVISPQDEYAAAIKVYFEQGPKEALPRLQHALESLRGAGDRKGEAIALGFIGNCYKHLGDQKQALGYLLRALELKRSTHDRLEEGRTLNHLGLLYWEMADYSKAIDYFQQSSAVAHEVGDKQLEAQVLNNAGLVYDEEGDYARSLPSYEQALNLDREIKFERGEAETIANIGGVHLELGRFREAASDYQQSRELAEHLKLKALASQASGNLALCQAALGRTTEAIENFDRALRLAQEVGFVKEEADWHKGKGSAYLSEGKFDVARAEYSAAIETYEKSQFKRELVEALSDRGELYLELGDIASAERDFSRASDLAHSIDYARGVTDNLWRLGKVEMHRGRVQQAEKLYRESLDRAHAAGQIDTQAALWVLLAEFLRENGTSDEAVKAGQQGLELARSSGAALLAAKAQYEIAEALLKQDKPQEALRTYDDCATTAHATGAADLEWRIAYGQGRALQALRRDDDALAAYIRAVSLLEGIRSEIAEERFRSGYFQGKDRVYADLVRLLIKLGRTKEAFFYSERLRAHNYRQLIADAPAGTQGEPELELRARIRQLQRELADPGSASRRRRPSGDQLREQLQTAEREYEAMIDDLRSRYPQYATVIGLRSASSDVVQQELPENAAVIEFMFDDDALSEFVVTHSGIWANTVTTGGSLEPKIELMRALIARHTGTDWTGPAAALYKLLITPAERSGALMGIKRLYIVPNGALHYIPLAVLVNKGASGRMRLLVQDYEVAYLPSASAIERDRTEPASGTLLAMAPSEPDLVYTQMEVRNISRYFRPPQTVLSGSFATKPQFEMLAGSYRVIHLATHGYFDKFNPLFSGIEFQSSKGESGRLDVYDVLRLRLRSDLVTLSACETGLSSGFFSELPAGDEFVGLTTALLSAGSTAVIASLWNANDSSTATFMQKFYKFQGHADRVAAISRAQREMITAGGRYSHPFYWAPFVLTETGSQKEKSLRKREEPIRVSPAVANSTSEQAGASHEASYSKVYVDCLIRDDLAMCRADYGYRCRSVIGCPGNHQP
jgi:CHAT domain-containing protein/Flp pilus assembly protein TadD